MLSAFVMKLEQEDGTWVYCEALYLVALPGVQLLVATPGSVHSTVGLAFLSSRLFEPIHNLANVLGMVLVCDQHGVGCLDDDDVF